MAVQDIVLAGFGSTGTVSLVVTSGYESGVAVIPSAVAIPSGGAGYPVYWQGKRRKAKLKERPNEHLRYILDKVVSEYYREIVASDVPLAIKREAAAVVRPFVDRKTQGIPNPGVVDWAALQRDAGSVGTILQIWHEEIQDEIDREDEEFMMS